MGNCWGSGYHYGFLVGGDGGGEKGRRLGCTSAFGCGDRGRVNRTSTLGVGENWLHCWCGGGLWACLLFLVHPTIRKHELGRKWSEGVGNGLLFSPPPSPPSRNPQYRSDIRYPRLRGIPYVSSVPYNKEMRLRFDEFLNYSLALTYPHK